MKVSWTASATPDSTPPSGRGREGVGLQARDEGYVWTALVPRLVHPGKLAIITALIEADRPLSVDDLIPLLPVVDRNPESIGRHVDSMVEAGTLEVVSTRFETASRAPCYAFPSPGTGSDSEGFG